MKTAGIYKIQRIGTNQCYVGSSHWIGKRWATHRRELNSDTHQAHRLQNSWNKYGAEAFEFVILETVCGDGQALKSLLVEREQAWMDQLTPCFNTVPAAGSTLGFKMPREIVERHRQQITGRKVTQEEAERLRTLALGAKRSEATKDKLRQHGIRRGIPRSAVENSANARRGKTLSEGHIEQMRANSTGRRHKPEVLAARSAALTPEIRDRMGASVRGKKQSPEQVAKRIESTKRTKEANRQKIVMEAVCA